MKIIATRAEHNLSELARRLFKIEGPHATAAERKAVAALRHENPHLRPGGALVEGMPIVVPNVEGLEVSAAPVAAFDFAKTGAAELRAALAGLDGMLEAAHAEKLKEEDAAARDLKQHGRELNSVDPAVKERVTVAQQAAKRRAKDLAERRKLDQQALARLLKDSEILTKVLK